MGFLGTPLAAIGARLPAWGSARRDAAREEERRAIAAFLAAAGGPGEPLPSPAPPVRRGFGGAFLRLWHLGRRRYPRDTPGLGATPGIGAAIEGHRRAFAGDHEGAAEAFFRAASAIPDIDDDNSDETRHWQLSKALAMMLVARHAARAGLAEVEWTGFGTAEQIAASAVARQPLLPYLRFEQSELLRDLGRVEDAFAVLVETRPLAADLAARMKLADAAGEIAAVSRDPALLARAEAEFIAPVLAEGRDDGPADPAMSDPDARGWAWIIAFRAGKLAHVRAEIAEARGEATGRLAGLAARRFERSRTLMARAITRVSDEDRKNIAEWRRISLRLEAEIALAVGRPVYAARRLRWTGETDKLAMADRLRGWTRSGKPARFAAAALLHADASQDSERVGLDALASAASPWRDPARIALPPVPDPVVVEAMDPLLIDEDLANRIIGNETGPSIRTLRDRLKQRFRLNLPGVRLRGVHDESIPLQIRMVLQGEVVSEATVPNDAELAMASAVDAAAAGVAPLPEPAPSTGGRVCCWVRAGTTRPGIMVLPPAFAIVGVLEAGFVDGMARWLGLDDAAEIFPSLDSAHLPRAVMALRALLADRTPIGTEGMLEVVRARLDAGDAPKAVVAHLRALPGFRHALWGNEPGRTELRLPAALEAEVTTRGAGPLPASLRLRVGDAVASMLEGVTAPILVVETEVERRWLRAALVDRFPDLPVMTLAERSTDG